ncbi:hypothetical protein PENSPDRAFT_658169 [Peniophora sp. CONT]|nr:hypothetical protein PENSPDRAFT_658169 [Peniophora sp. CONT]
MSDQLEFRFEGGNILNRDEYSEDVMRVAMVVMKDMGKNLDTRYATVDVDGAKRDLAAHGWSVMERHATDTLSTIDSSIVDDKLNELIHELFWLGIRLVDGRDLFMALMSYAIDGLVPQTDGGFFGSTTHSEGTYFAYQMAFFQQDDGSFCFLVLSLIAFKDQHEVFGIPTGGVKTGISYNIQVFKVY